MTIDRTWVFETLGIRDINPGLHDGLEAHELGDAPCVDSLTPIDGSHLASVRCASVADYERMMATAQGAFETWRMMPAPQRGLIVREVGEALREKKAALGALVTLEMGKILSEGEGEVQEMIDICDFAVGLSRQLYGLTMHSERPQHRMYEQWHPLGNIGIITAFNFPVAVWAWNAMIAAVCGDVMVWKPSHKTPLTAVAVQNIVAEVCARHKLRGVFNMIVAADHGVGEAMTGDRRLPLISATGSCSMGRKVGSRVAERLGRSLLELGGNNAIIVMDDADLDMAARAILFGAVGTAGQRCTSTRRVFMHKKIAKELRDGLVKAYASVRIGDPLDRNTLMGPLVDETAIDAMMAALELARTEGGEILCGGRRIERPGYYVEPTIVAAHRNMSVWREETFAPILYLFEVESYEEAIAMHNEVDQGLSSSIFTLNMRTAERFLSHAGSDCGIANVNIGTSGAEIGGAFGGEKDTGGGRESGSDSWKIYMRRQTNTINWSTDLPLAQGVEFEI
ncbi:MAG: aldehyde dehydrogenase family protein [Planctomycetes bacterium]|nr:aldehyde dehydrogenase family protein [Planctomycetota bacterium]